jgi:hypothetical protein
MIRTLFYLGIMALIVFIFWSAYKIGERKQNKKSRLEKQ